MHGLLVGSVSAVAVLSTYAAAVLASPGGQANILPRPPAARVVTLPRAPGDKPQETYVAVNPRDPRQVVVSYHQAVEEGSDHHPGVPVDLHVASSADGGKTWAVARGTNESYLKSLDAAVAFDLHGHAFLAHLALDKIGYVTRHGEFVRRSLDGGRTWDASPIVLIERPEKEAVLDHMPRIVADTHAASPYAGNVYVVWDRALGDPTSGDKLESETVFSRSTDDGQTWSRPRVVSKHPTSLNHTVAVGYDGTLYVLYALSWGGDRETMLAISRDGGQTFEAPRPVMRTRAASSPVANFPRGHGRPVIAIDRSGRGKLFIVWGDYRNGDRDILAITSSDGGRTWTPPVRVNDDPVGNGRDQTMEWPAVDSSDGTLYVLFYDRRSDPNNVKPTVTLARSTDGGRTFVNYAWSERTSDPRQASLGDYIGMAAQDGRVYGAWVENIAEPRNKPRKESRKEPHKAGPGEIVIEDDKWPSGPSAIRVGIADFRSAVITEQQRAGR